MAEAHVHLLLAAGEQAAIQSWDWPLAWLFTQLPEPPWSRIRHAPVPDTARPLSRLADQALLSAVLSFYKDVNTVMEAQNKAVPTGSASVDPKLPPEVPKKANPRRPRGGRGNLGNGGENAQGQAPQ